MKKGVKKKTILKKVGKKSLKNNSTAFGISGFTLAIVGIVTILLNPMISAVALLVGLVFCIIQQKRNKTRIGKAGLILNIVGLVLNIVWWIALFKYILPKLMSV